MPEQVRHKADTAFGVDQVPNVTTVPRSNTIYKTSLTEIKRRRLFNLSLGSNQPPATLTQLRYQESDGAEE